jgi:flagellar biosynthesis/type III secretory pathway ATPase
VVWLEQMGTSRLVIGLVGEWGREVIESVTEEDGGATEVEGGGTVVTTRTLGLAG